MMTGQDKNCTLKYGTGIFQQLMISLESESMHWNLSVVPIHFRCSVELSDYEPDIQHDLRLPVGKSSGVLHLHLVISGLSCKEEDTIMSESLMEKAKIDYVSQES